MAGSAAGLSENVLPAVVANGQDDRPGESAQHSVTEDTAQPERRTLEPPPLIFDWRPQRGVRRRLAVWLLVVAAGHAALFYLFRVAPPLASRKPPPQHAVLYLPPADPEVLALLSSVDDRHPGSVLQSEDYFLQADMAALAKVTPPSAASWAGHVPELKKFEQPLVPQELPRMLVPGDPLLPESEPPPAQPAPVPDAAKRVLSAVIDDSPGGRTILQPPAWPDRLADDTWPASGSIPFMLGVSPGGRPDYCLALSPATGVDLEALRRGLMGMKFSASSGGPQWLNVAVRW